MSQFNNSNSKWQAVHFRVGGGRSRAPRRGRLRCGRGGRPAQGAGPAGAVHKGAG